MKAPRLAFVLMLLALISLTLPAQEEEQLGEWAVDFKATAIDGKTVVLSGFTGKLVFMDFWATWCEPCMEEVPGIVAAWKKLGGGGKVAFLGVTLDTPSQVKLVKDTMVKMGMTWAQIFDDGSDVNGETISAAYKVVGIPAPFLIDGDTGKIVARDSALRGNRLIPTLEAAIKAKK